MTQLHTTCLPLRCDHTHLDDGGGVGQAGGFNHDGIKLVAPLEELVEDADEVAAHCGVVWVCGGGCVGRHKEGIGGREGAGSGLQFVEQGNSYWEAPWLSS